MSCLANHARPPPFPVPSFSLSSFAVPRYDTCKHKSLAPTLYKRNSLRGYESFIRYHSRESFFLENGAGGGGGGGVGNCFMDFTRSSSLLRFRSLFLSLSLSISKEFPFHTPRNKLLYLKSLITARIRFLRYTAMRIFPSFRKNGGHTLIFFFLFSLPVKCYPPIFYHYLIVYFLIFFSFPLFLFFFSFSQRNTTLYVVHFVPRLGEKEKEKKGDVSTLYRNPSSFFFGFFFWLLYR